MVSAADKQFRRLMLPSTERRHVGARARRALWGKSWHSSATFHVKRMFLPSVDTYPGSAMRNYQTQIVGADNGEDLAIVLPPEFLERFHLKVGDELLMTQSSSGIQLAVSMSVAGGAADLER